MTISQTDYQPEPAADPSTSAAPPRFEIDSWGARFSRGTDDFRSYKVRVGPVRFSVEVNELTGSAQLSNDLDDKELAFEIKRAARTNTLESVIAEYERHTQMELRYLEKYCRGQTVQ